MKKIVLFLLVQFSLSLQAQKSINIACTDFTFNDKKSIDGKNTTDIFESALMQSTPLIRLLERKKLDYILSKIDEEKKLAYDFGEQTKKDLILAGVDYVVTGNIFMPFGYDTAALNIQFTKISGKDVTTKFIISISINKEELYNPSKLKNEIIENLKKTPFVDKLGLIEKDQIEEINKQLDEKDKRIQELETNDRKRKLEEDNFEKLKLTPPELDIDFMLINDSFAVKVISKNHVPIKFHYSVVKFDDNEPLGDLVVTMKYTNIWHPQIGSFRSVLVSFFCSLSEYNFSKTEKVKLKVIFEYRSIFFEEMRYDQKLSSVLTKYYTFNPVTRELNLDEN